MNREASSSRLFDRVAQSCVEVFEFVGCWPLVYYAGILGKISIPKGSWLDFCLDKKESI